MNFKQFYEWYHRDRKLPKRIVGPKNFTYRTIISVLDKYCKEKEILDIGSGVGTLDFYLASKGVEITGVEISERAFRVTQKSLRLFGLENKIHLERSDFFKFKTSRKYKFIICSEVMEHLKDDKQALKKIYHLLKPEGLLLLTVPSENAPLIKLGLIKNFDKRSGHLRRYSVEKLKKFLKINKFLIISTKKTEGILRNSLFVFRLNLLIKIANRFTPVSDVLTFLDNIFLKIFGESQVIVVARKKV